MSEQNIVSSETTPSTNRRAPVAGLILIVIGIGMLLSQFLHFEGLFPLLLGTAFLAAGIVRRSNGLLIPGGIIGGVGLGTLATLNNWFAPMGTPEQGGVFLLFFSLGWFTITVLSALVTRETMTWPLIPGGIMALIGGLILMGERGLKILEVIGTYWPVVLVVIGFGILLGWWKNR